MKYRVKHPLGFQDELDPIKADALAVHLGGVVISLPDDPAPTQTLEEAIELGEAHIAKFFSARQMTHLSDILLENSSLVAAAQNKIASYWMYFTNSIKGDEPETTQIDKIVAVKAWLKSIPAAAKANPATFDPNALGNPPFLYKECM